MKVFISWSGDRSYEIAAALHDWLPKVLQSVKPWMSDRDIPAGERWSAALSVELEGSFFGIICLTPENKEAPWIMFEAGALSKTTEKTFVCPYLFDMSIKELTGPLTQFQNALSDKKGTLKLVDMLNAALSPNGLGPMALEEVFDVWWPKLKAKIDLIPLDQPVDKKPRSTNDILEELLNNSREQLRKLEMGFGFGYKEESSVSMLEEPTRPYYGLNAVGVIFNIQLKEGQNKQTLMTLLYQNKIPADAYRLTYYGRNMYQIAFTVLGVVHAPKITRLVDAGELEWSKK